MSETVVYVVEDEPIQREILLDVLSNTFTVEAFANGEDFLERFEGKNPAVILLDIELPGINGYQVCESVNAKFDQSNFSVIFLSGHSSLEERLKGYELGADDYMSKPYDIQELSNKIKNAVDRVSNKGSLKQQADYASSTAFQAMTAQSEMGTILKGVGVLNQAQSFKEIIDSAFECLAELGLISTIYHKIGDEEGFTASPGRQSSPIEQEIINFVRPTERIWSKGNRSMYNFSFSSLLILNMPDDKEKAGRYRDILCFLMEAIDAKMDAVSNLTALVNARLWRESITEITGILAESSEQLEESVANGNAVVNKMMVDLSNLLPGLGLEEDQETRIFDIVETTSDEFRDSMETNEQTRVVFHEVVNKLKRLMQ